MYIAMRVCMHACQANGLYTRWLKHCVLLCCRPLTCDVARRLGEKHISVSRWLLVVIMLGKRGDPEDVDRLVDKATRLENLYMDLAHRSCSLEHMCSDMSAKIRWRDEQESKKASAEAFCLGRNRRGTAWPSPGHVGLGHSLKGRQRRPHCDTP